MRLFKVLCRTDTKKKTKLVFTSRQITFIAFFLSNRESKILNLKIEMLPTQIFRLLPKVKEYFSCDLKGILKRIEMGPNLIKKFRGMIIKLSKNTDVIWNHLQNT